MGSLGLGCTLWLCRNRIFFANYLYIQQMKLVDFSELVVKGDQDKEKFWDWVDSKLENLRDLHKDKTESDRKDAISLWVMHKDYSLVRH